MAPRKLLTWLAVLANLLVIGPCFAQSSDPFRSAPVTAPEGFRSAPAPIPGKPTRSPRPTPRQEQTTQEPVAVLPSPDLESSAWQAIATSSKAEDFEEYLRRFPQGRFIG